MKQTNRTIRLLAFLATLSFAVTATGAQCVADVFEPDDACIPSPGVLRGPSASQPHNFCDDSADWVKFNACAGRSYTVRTEALAASADTVLEIVAPDCVTVLATDDDGGGPGASLLEWTASSNGVHHVRVFQKDGSHGSDRDYGLVLEGDTSPCSTWAHDHGNDTESEFYDRPWSVLERHDGDWFVFGDAYSYYGEELSADVRVVRLGPDGAVRWERTFLMEGYQGFGEAALTTEGGILFTARTDDPVTLRSDVWIARLSEDGELLWSRSYGGNDDEAFDGLVGLPDGTFVAAGWTYSGCAISCPWVLKIDGSGEVVWSQKYSGGDAYAAVDLIPLPDGEFVVAGERSDMGDCCFDVLVFRIDDSGTVIWATSLGLEGREEYPWDVTALEGGGVLVAGDEWIPGENYQGLFAMFDRDGVLQWHRRLLEPPDGFLSVNGVAAAPDGGAVAATLDYLLRLDAAGNLIWQQEYGKSIYTVGAAADGGWLLGGSGYDQHHYRVREDGTIDYCALDVPSSSLVVEEFPVDSHSLQLQAQSFQLQIESPMPTVDETIHDLGETCGCLPIAYGGILRVAKTSVSWTAEPRAVYDVVRGDLWTLRGTGGNFTAALDAIPVGVSVCLANNTSLTSVSDTFALATGGAVFYLLRTVNVGCAVEVPDTYDSGSPKQIGSRDLEVSASQRACP